MCACSFRTFSARDYAHVLGVGLPGCSLGVPPFNKTISCESALFLRPSCVFKKRQQEKGQQIERSKRNVSNSQ